MFTVIELFLVADIFQLWCKVPAQKVRTDTTYHDWPV